MEFANISYAYEHIETLSKKGRPNILFNDEYTNLKTGHKPILMFTVDDNGCLLVQNGYGEIMSIEELSNLIPFLSHTVKHFNEKKSIQEEINEVLEYINKPKEKKEVEVKNKKGYVYLIQGENGRYKIGFSSNVNTRLSQLKLSSCEDHKLIHNYHSNNVRLEEDRLHNMFKDKNTHSEWFDLDDSDIEYIKGL